MLSLLSALSSKRGQYPAVSIFYLMMCQHQLTRCSAHVVLGKCEQCLCCSYSDFKPQSGKLCAEAIFSYDLALESSGHHF